jgi:hypothetical protein
MLSVDGGLIASVPSPKAAAAPPENHDGWMTSACGADEVRKYSLAHAGRKKSELKTFSFSAGRIFPPLRRVVWLLLPDAGVSLRTAWLFL